MSRKAIVVGVSSGARRASNIVLSTINGVVKRTCIVNITAVGGTIVLSLRLDFECVKGRGINRSVTGVSFPLAISSTAWKRRADVVLKAHVLCEGIRTCEGFITLYMTRNCQEISAQGNVAKINTGARADEWFFPSMRTDMRYQCKAGRLGKATSGTCGPFAGVI